MAKRKLEYTFSGKTYVSVTSGILEKDFTWKIENFEVVKSSKDLVGMQQFNFEVGEYHGYLTKWRCQLQREKESIGISLNLIEAPPRSMPFISYSFTSLLSNGEVCNVINGQRKSFRQGTGVRNRTFISANEGAIKKLICEDGSLVIKLDFKLFIEKPAVMIKKVTNLQKQVNEFEKMEFENCSKSTIEMLDGKPEAGRIVKMVAKDGEEFWVKTDILSARSPVFKVMFASGNWREEQSSEGGDGGGELLVLEDLSGKTLKVLLHYLYGGVLLKDDWKGEDVIVELVWAAEKYGLDNLTEFLDKALPEMTFASTDVMGKLALLTKRLGMKNAEKGLLGKLKEAAVNDMIAIYLTRNIL